jgi:DNA-binding transcriptional MocR family regulator
VSWIEPNGGFTIWMSMNNTKLTYDEINKIFYNNKIRLATGRDFFSNPVKNKYFRLAIASLDEEEITEGLERLSDAVREIYCR